MHILQDSVFFVFFFPYSPFSFFFFGGGTTPTLRTQNTAGEQISLVEENVGSLQDWIRVKANAAFVPQFALHLEEKTRHKKHSEGGGKEK